MKGEIKKCPKCGGSFECKNYNILNCACIEVQLNNRARQILSEQYDDCLCVNCLKEIVKEPGSSFPVKVKGP